MEPTTGPNWCGNSRLDRDSIPGPSISSDSLYRLSYTGPRLRLCAETNRLWEYNSVHGVLTGLDPP